MPLSFSQRRKILKNTNFLDLRPIRNHKEEISENEIVTIIIPKFKNKLVVKYLVPRMKSPVIKLTLDEIGSSAWLFMDGKNKVSEIANLMEQKLGEKVKPIEHRLMKFLTQLYEQGLITFEEIKGE